MATIGRSLWETCTAASAAAAACISPAMPALSLTPGSGGAAPAGRPSWTRGGFDHAGTSCLGLVEEGARRAVTVAPPALTQLPPPLRAWAAASGEAAGAAAEGSGPRPSASMACACARSARSRAAAVAAWLGLG